MTDTYDEMDCGSDDICIKPLLRRAYGIFWDHAVLLISAHLIMFIILIVGNQLLTVGGNVLMGPFILGFSKISLRLARNQNTDLSDLLSGFEYFLPAFVANIIIQIFATAASFLLVIPGLLVLLTYITTFFFILEKNLGFWDAMEASRALVWSNFRRWLAVGVAILLVNLAGLVFFGIGLLITLPFTLQLVAVAYDDELQARDKRAATEFPAHGAPIRD